MEALEAKLGMNSESSSKPSPSDALSKKRPMRARSPLDARTKYEQIIPAIPASSGRVKRFTAVSLLHSFRQYADAVFRFVGNSTVPFTNNIAERAVHLPKTKQKISGCCRTLDALSNFAVFVPAWTYYTSIPWRRYSTRRAAAE